MNVPTYTNLARFREHLWDILGLLNSAANEFFEQRDLDGLCEGMRQGKFRPVISVWPLHSSRGKAHMYEDPLRRVMTSLYILRVS